jgi:hypothetical protein
VAFFAFCTVNCTVSDGLKTTTVTYRYSAGEVGVSLLSSHAAPSMRRTHAPARSLLLPIDAQLRVERG